MKLKTFKISFKQYYHELCDWSSEYVQAKDRCAALQKFAKRHKITDANINDPESWWWCEDDWYSVFRLINEVAGKPKSCPHCDGTGLIEA